MMIIMQTDATQEEITSVVERVEVNGLRAHLSQGEERTVIGVVGDGRFLHQDQFLHLPGVDRVIPISRPYKLASREFIPENSLFCFRWMV
jgi:3-deoxy-7-phosphoheptulonate synthase